MLHLYFKNRLIRPVLTLSLFISSVLFAQDSKIQSGYIDVDQGKIFYESAGSGPVIIMIHDGILHRVTWDAQFSEFSKKYKVIRWDRRGYGKSPAPEAAFSHLEDLFKLTQVLNVKKAALMGCSSGGLLAINFTIEYPDMVTALVLVGPIVSGFDFTDHMRTRGGRGYDSPNATIEQKIEYWSFRDPWVTDPNNQTTKKKMAELLRANPQNMTGSGRYARRIGRPALNLLPKIKVPTLLIAGEYDIPDVHAHIGAIQAGITGSRRVILTKSGHLAHFEMPEEFNRVVLDFLATAN